MPRVPRHYLKTGRVGDCVLVEQLFSRCPRRFLEKWATIVVVQKRSYVVEIGFMCERVTVAQSRAYEPTFVGVHRFRYGPWPQVPTFMGPGRFYPAPKWHWFRRHVHQ